MFKQLPFIGRFLIPVLLIVLLSSCGGDGSSDIEVEVKRGPLEVTVYTTGELEAKNSINIMGPGGLRMVRIWNVKISELVEEGTRVKKGDFISTLDRTEITNKIKDGQSELQKIQSEYTQARLDTTLDLRKAVDELVNLKYKLKEKEIALEQSKFEPPATIRQAEIEVEKAKRELQQAEENYKIKKALAIAKMQSVGASLEKAENWLQRLYEVEKEFTVIAPADGMVIYERSWNGQRKTIGSDISAWDPVVATLPDLSTMISKTYVNEVDIRKIEKGQEVLISLDAFPEKKLTGKVIKVANVGEQKAGSDAKVFEVKVEVNESDTTLRPAMTTGNHIIAETLQDVLFIPLEAIHSQGDSLTFVYQKDGLSTIKKEVAIGKTNENFAEVQNGLNQGEKLLLSIPDNDKDMKIEFLKKNEAITSIRKDD